MAITGRGRARLGGRRAVGLLVTGTAVALALAAGGSVSQAGAATQDATQDTAAQDTAAQAKKPKPTHSQIQLLAINDFHGNLEPATGSSGNINGIPAGGAAYLATHLKQLRAAAHAKGQDSVTVAAGDLIGASPLLSAAFHDEPTVEALNGMGLEAASVGNHEFDEGWHELLRMQTGGCLPDGDGANNQNSCPDAAHPFEGAKFKYLAANVFFENTRKTLFAPYTIKTFKDGKKVGFIGMTLENTPNIVTKSGVEGLTFKDEVDTANALVPVLKKKGVESIVVLLHEGGFPADPKAYNSCPGISGPIMDINANLDPEIDAIISGHTHQGYNCSLPDKDKNPRLVTSASSFGRLVTDVRLSIDNATGDVDRVNTLANNQIITQDVVQDPKTAALIAKYKALVAPIENKVIGHITTPSVVRTPDDSLESPLGNLIADAQLADPSVVTGGKTPVVAFMNPGGIRADLASTNGEVTFGKAFTVQPFNNFLVSMDMTGTQIKALLEQQFSGVNGPDAPKFKVLQVAGITYTWNPAAAAGSKVVAGSIKIGGQPLVDGTTYRIVTNNFLSDGGDGFPAFTTATNKFFGGLDIDAFANYLTAHDPYTPVATDRISIGS
ncbi:bifunctional metallophosphatase/5'-nucleotidase [Kribbella speibonae]|uniref:Bifunctional metallophosphatase/5'-nucleotidase n=1 Tax=Kribbella speibonae TaxID=1572660 RepID=A0A4R0IB11_9ACTN|nr:bifunctional metallophosphatase/5'-nucleotidase [Kribbella speibonae]TCC29539.1 bifunctional metallophosphatase/5'-nucleotidase [Kribbella speibonae]